MKILFYNTDPTWGPVYGAFLYKLQNYLRDGNEIIMVNCDGIGVRRCCKANIYGLPSACIYCKMVRNATISRLRKQIEVHQLSEFILSDTPEPIFPDRRFQYHSLDEIKRIEYKGINIGLGCVSSYIFYTRNLNPCMDDRFKQYMDDMLADSVRLQERLSAMLDCIPCDKYVFVNGRLAENRPLYEILRKRGKPFESVEVVQISGVLFQTEFHDTIPQDIPAAQKRISNLWESDEIPDSEKENLAKEFFEGRRQNKNMGDKSYTIGQEKDCLPDNFDQNKYNVVIFNSSEDEYFSISTEDVHNLYSTQLDAYRDIISHFVHDQEIHFYLRVHPNLKNIHYRYHTDLYSLEQQYDNVTIIPADSRVSSYSLLDIADKVIVFLSTMGLEAAYAGKTVISLCRNGLYGDDVAYIPRTKNELYEMISSRGIQPKPSKESLKYGFYYMYNGLNDHFRLPQQPEIVRLFGMKYTNMPERKLVSSNLLFIVVDMVSRFFLYKLPMLACRYFKDIPRKESAS